MKQKLKRKIITLISLVIKFCLYRLKLGRKMFIFTSGGMLAPSLFFKVHSLAIENIYGPSINLASGTIPKDLLNEMLALQSDIGTQSFEDTLNDYSGELLVDKHDSKILAALKKNLDIYPLHNLAPDHLIIQRLHAQLRKMFAAHIRSPFIFVNTRMWGSKPNSELQGPNLMHTDGFESGHQKIMIYLSPMNIDHGYLKFEDQEINNRPPGTAVLFDNSDIIHMGVPGVKHIRISIEVTIMRSFIDRPQLNKSHFFGRHLLDPILAYRNNSSIPAENSEICEGLKINLGSGICDWADWTCFDQIEHKDVTNISFDSTFTLPVDENEVALAYSSHNFEHLPDTTITKVLHEIRRTLKPKGIFLLKIPDFDWFLEQYKYGIEESISKKGLEEVMHTWESQLVEPSFENKVAMMICGYWNKEYGDHFSSETNINEDAYHGPPKVTKELMRDILISNSPKEISDILNPIALTDENFKDFNHQNAWSNKEMRSMLNINGFSVVTDDKEFILRKYRLVIPDLYSMEDFSSFYLCKKNSYDNYAINN